jgi:hypothetical protein
MTSHCHKALKQIKNVWHFILTSRILLELKYQPINALSKIQRQQVLNSYMFRHRVSSCGIENTFTQVEHVYVSITLTVLECLLCETIKLFENLITLLSFYKFYMF